MGQQKPPEGQEGEVQHLQPGRPKPTQPYLFGKNQTGSSFAEEDLRAPFGQVGQEQQRALR